MEKTTSFSEVFLKINQFISYIGTFVIFLSTLKLVSFYNSFGISIISYLEFSELLISFFEVIVVCIFILLVLMIHDFLFSRESKHEKQKLKINALLNEKKVLKILWLYIKILRYPLLLSSIVYLLFLFCNKSNLQYLSATLKFIFSFYILTITLLILKFEIDRKLLNHKFRRFSKQFILLTLVFLGFTITIVLYSEHQTNLIRKAKSNFGVEITFDTDNKFVSDSFSYYIGKTRNFIFIYDEKNKTADVYPMSRIKKIKLTAITKN